MDETGIMTVPKKRSKCLALRGKKQIGCLSSGERGVLVTAETCMSATGVFMPTMFVFPRERAKPELLDNAPPGTSAAYHSSGWMQTDIFVNWFKKFITFSNPTKEKPVLVLLDGHATHTKSLALKEMARANNVILLCFPPHTTHRLQPLDVSFMSPVSTYYAENVQKWLQMHPGRAVTISQVGELYGAAFMKAACVQTAVNGFKATGIYPFNPEIFPDWMFEPSETTNRPLDETIPRSVTPQPSLQIPEHATPVKTVTQNPVNHLPTVPASVGSGDDLYAPSCSTSSNFVITPKQIVNIPQAPERKSNSGDRRRGKTAILTSTPYKNDLQETIAARLAKTSKKKPKLNLEDTTKKNKVISTLSKKKVVKKQVAAKVNDNISSSSSDEEDDDNATCMYCNKLYSNSKSEEGWIKCHKCSDWAHEQCAGIEPDDDEVFTCDFCH